MGKYCIMNLSKEEQSAAMVAIKKVRGSTIKNTFFEGVYIGMEIQKKLYRGEYPLDANDAWESSHAKMLEDSKTK